MAVTATDHSISLSSSGYADGLGRRALEVDRESGDMIERLVVRPELTAFEHVLRARVAHAATFKDQRFARPRSVSWDDEGHLTVASTYVNGRRLSDVIDLAAMAGVIGGIDAAIGLLLELLPALSSLHTATNFAHGLLGTGRLTVTPSGTLVVLDWVYGATVEHLQLTRQRLWDELGIAAHPSPGPPRLDLASDLTQSAMIAAALVVGRPLGDNDYPTGIPALRAEIVDVAHIRGNQEFSRGIERYFERALPIRPRRVFSSADEALFELRTLLKNSIGIEPCRAALRDFLQEAEAVDPEGAELLAKLEGPSHEHRIDDVGGQGGRAAEPPKPQTPASKSSTKNERREPAPIRVERFELERIATDQIEQERRARDESERSAREKAEAERLERELLERGRAIREMEELQRLAREKAHAERIAREAAEAERIAREQAEAERVAARKAEADAQAAKEAEPAHDTDQAAAATAIAAPPEPALTAPTDADLASAAEPEPAPLETEPESLVRTIDGRRRRKKDRSARARKDRLRSSGRPAENDETRKSGASWLVRPDRAAAFEPPAPQLPPPSASSQLTPARVRAVAVAPGVPLDAGTGISSQPAATLETEPPEASAQLNAPDVQQPIALQQTPAPQVTAKSPQVKPTFQTIKLKAPQGRPHGTITRASTKAPERLNSIAPGRDFPQRPEYDEPVGERGTPWKSLAAAVVILMGGGYAALNFWSATPAKAVTTAAAVSGTAPAPVPASSTTGRVEIATEPAGARVLFDGKPAGVSPATVPDVSPGRHIVTVLAEAGTVKRTIKVEAGATARVEVPIFSGFAAITAPIVVDVSENGRSLGTSDNHVMLTPGRHELHLTNKELNYATTETVDVEPGEVKEVKLDPKGAANINAEPWAEVWIDGTKVGDTPLANLALPLGSREIVFRNPQFGERKVMATITAGAPANISVDLSK